MRTTAEERERNMSHAIADASRDRRDEITDERRRAITTRIRWVARHVRSFSVK